MRKIEERSKQRRWNISEEFSGLPRWKELETKTLKKNRSGKGYIVLYRRKDTDNVWSARTKNR